MDGDGKSSIEQVRLHSDIVETIGRYVPLKKVGGRFKALCPFHKEKTPSFQVDATKQLFHCFGCGAGGDVFSFVMQYENVDFVEAARILADRAGLEFNPKGMRGEGAVARSEKSDLYALHEQLAAFYAERLAKDGDAETARAYLKQRDLESACADFQLGYAPAQQGVLANWSRQAKQSSELLEKAGVLMPSDRGGKPYDRFRGRLMFPIRDEQGRVVGFSGRILDKSSPAKYVNSPETALFKKSRILYALDRARQHMVEARQAIVCEGQIDVIRCHLAGFQTAVAPQGTALTDAHARLLKRYADEVILVFDADIAGQNAALRGAEVLLQEGLTVRIAALPKGEDPDTLIVQRGESAFSALLEQAHSLVGFHVQVQRERGELDTDAGRLRAIRAVLETVLHAPSAVQRETFLREAADLLETSQDALRADMMKLNRPAPPASQPPAPERAAPAYPPNELALIELMVAHPEIWDMVSQHVPPEAITHPISRTIIQTMMAMPEPDEAHLMQELAEQGDECRRLMAKIQMTARMITGEEVSCIQAAQDIILKLRIQLIDREIKACLQQSQSATKEQRRLNDNECAQLMLLKKQMQRGWEAALPILELDD